MTAAALLGAALLGVAVGAVIETRLTQRRPNPVPDNPGLLVQLDEARRDADHWHDEYHRTDQALRQACASAIAWKRRAVAWEQAATKWHRTCREHETILAALGRTVAEGGRLEAPDA